jgi:hypothetical protein
MCKQPTPNEMLADIRAHCLDCMGGSRKAVQQCTSRDCRLWRYRTAENQDRPRKEKNQMTIFDYLREAQS